MNESVQSSCLLPKNNSGEILPGQHLSAKERRRRKWGVRIAWIEGKSSGGVLRRSGSGPQHRGGTCDVCGAVRMYNDLDGFVFIRHRQVRHAEDKRLGFAFLCELGEVEAIWRLLDGQPYELIYRKS